MEIGNIIPHIEALIFASDRPLTTLEITELINNAFGFMEDKITLEQVEASLEGIIEKYRAEFYPFELRESGGGLQFLTKKEYHKTVAQLNGEKFLKRLSPAALETLAIIAYKQPITKADIESIRGVSCDYSIQKLLEKELIVITGRNEELPGKPLVYVTSKNFMDYFGLNSPDDLPKLKEVFDEAAVNPTAIQAQDEPETELNEDGLLVVTETGELLQGPVLPAIPESEFSGQETEEGQDETTAKTGDDEELDVNPGESELNEGLIEKEGADDDALVEEELDVEEIYEEIIDEDGIEENESESGKESDEEEDQIDADNEEDESEEELDEEDQIDADNEEDDEDELEEDDENKFEEDDKDDLEDEEESDDNESESDEALEEEEDDEYDIEESESENENESEEESEDEDENDEDDNKK